MSVVTVESLDRRSLIEDRRAQFFAVLSRYGAKNPRLFGSVARGDATADSDVDVLVDLTDGSRNPLLAVAGLSEELSDLLGVRVDVVTESLLRDGVSRSALAQAAPL
jgi:predicted nucleotidyltransferase